MTKRYIEMYRDTAATYGLCEDINDDDLSDNSVGLHVPYDYLKTYYETRVQPENDFYTEINYMEWLDTYYDYDDMEGLLPFVFNTYGNVDEIKEAA